MAKDLGCTAVHCILCLDWCCQYGQNHLFKVDVCWITYEVDYLNRNYLNAKEKKTKTRTKMKF